jgi:hypothetical protein
MTARVLPLLSAAGSVLLGAITAHAAAPTPQALSQHCVGDPATCKASSANATTGIKWHPGHYMSIRNGHKYDSLDLRYVGMLANEPTVTGILRDWKWRDIETSKGVYDFSEIDAFVNALQSLPTPKRIIIRIENRIFGGHTGTAVPEYLQNDPTYLGGSVPMSSGVVARIWDAPVMDRLIALMQALAQRYDSNPYVEGISSSETAIGFSAAYPAPATFSSSALLTQLQRYTDAARLAWAHSNIFVETNYLGSDSQMQAFINTSVSDQAVVGGPDVVPGRDLQSDKVVNGEKGSGTDYRGVVAIKAEVQTPELGEKWSFEPNALYDLAYTVNRCNFMLWDRNDFYGGPDQKWTTGILPFIRSVNGKTVSVCPSSYQGRCVTN